MHETKKKISFIKKNYKFSKKWSWEGVEPWKGETDYMANNINDKNKEFLNTLGDIINL